MDPGEEYVAGGQRTTTEVPMEATALPAAEERPTVSVIEAAAALGISRSGAYAAAARGEIPTIRLGARRVVVPTAALRRMLGLDAS